MQKNNRNERDFMKIEIRPVSIEDYDGIFELWNSTEQSRRALNPVDDTREGIEKYSDLYSEITNRQMPSGKNRVTPFVQI